MLQAEVRGSLNCPRWMLVVRKEYFTGEKRNEKMSSLQLKIKKKRSLVLSTQLLSLGPVRQAVDSLRCVNPFDMG